MVSAICIDFQLFYFLTRIIPASDNSILITGNKPPHWLTGSTAMQSAISDLSGLQTYNILPTHIKIHNTLWLPWIISSSAHNTIIKYIELDFFCRYLVILRTRAELVSIDHTGTRNGSKNRFLWGSSKYIILMCNLEL